jgi:hypothetical protein
MKLTKIEIVKLDTFTPILGIVHKFQIVFAIPLQTKNKYMTILKNYNQLSSLAWILGYLTSLLKFLKNSNQ